MMSFQFTKDIKINKIEMTYLLLSVIAVLVVMSLVPIVLSDSLRGEFTVPNWVKNNAGWWSDDKIPDSAFIETIEFLIKDEIIIVKIPDLDSEVVEEVPGWVKNTAGWWAEDKIHDIAFVNAIKYLISQGIVYVEREQVEEPVEQVVEIKDFFMEVNGGSCSYCVNWAYVGKEYSFQIETFDERHGKYIDGVKISAKIISKGGELRHNFGQVTTEDGIYKNSITIPSMDWYAGNILSVTGEYYGVEKTIEKEFEVFYKKRKRPTCQHISCYTFTSVSNANDGSTFAELDGPREIALFTIGSSTYVIVAGQDDDGFEIIDISTPSSPTYVSEIEDDADKELEYGRDVEVATINGRTYAFVAAVDDDGLAVIDITDPTNPSYVNEMEDDADKVLDGAKGVVITTIDGVTYAVVTAYEDDGIEIIRILG